MKIAVIGAGISGLSAAYYLTRQGHQVYVYESGENIGGHTATIDVDTSMGVLGIDTGFIVYNDWTYPNFIQLMDEVGVSSQPTSMSFSVSCESTGLEYAGSDINGLFAQRRNIFNLRYLNMLRDIVRFNKEAIRDLESNKISAACTLGEYLGQRGYSDYFTEKYLVPMGAAIWSSGAVDMRDFPMAFFVEFFRNHGLLSIKNRPQWRVICGGSRSYLQPLTESFSDRIFTDIAVSRVQRSEHAVQLDYLDRQTHAMGSEQFDGLVLATHSDQALALLEDATDTERTMLSSIPYSSNDVVLHCDESLLPSRKNAWSSWNYRLHDAGDGGRARVTYNMNILQGLACEETYCVSLNQTECIDRSKIIGEYQYSHPVFTVDGMQTRQRWNEIAGQKRTWFCGAYWFNGFHEDGVLSAKRAAESIRHYAGERSGAHIG